MAAAAASSGGEEAKTGATLSRPGNDAMPPVPELTASHAQPVAVRCAMDDDIEYVLLTHAQIQKRLEELGAAISRDYAGLNPLVVGVLTGAIMVVADLVRHITVPCELDFLAASSYGMATTSCGVITIVKDIKGDPRGRHIIIVEDLVDTGRTLDAMMTRFAEMGAASVTCMALLDKAVGERDFHMGGLRYVGYKVPNRFIVGYGIDYAEKYRNLPYVGVVKPSVYQKPAADAAAVAPTTSDDASGAAADEGASG